MKKKRDIKKSAGMVMAAIIGAFASRYVDKVMAWTFPWDLIGLIVSAFILIAIVHFWWPESWSS